MNTHTNTYTDTHLVYISYISAYVSGERRVYGECMPAVHRGVYVRTYNMPLLPALYANSAIIYIRGVACMNRYGFV